MNNNICFIINPASGTGRWKGIEESIKKYLEPSLVPEIYYTEYPGHAKILAAEAAKKCSIIVAVGGDGIINEVASGMIHTEASIAIIPVGSGNALARHFGIPIEQKKALWCINQMHISTVDTGLVNDKLFLALSGTGFDAEVAEKFAASKKRGFFSYLYFSAVSYFNYKPSEYEIKIDGSQYHRKAFVISIANSSQFGNNATISPQASVKDGLLDVCIVKPFGFFPGVVLLYRLFRKTMHHSPYLEIIRGKIIEIRKAKENESLCMHFDGESGGKVSSLHFSVQTKSLKILTPENHGRI